MKEDFNTWKKFKSAKSSVEFFDLYLERGAKAKLKFRGTITIVKEYNEYFCLYEYSNIKICLNNYPFGNIKQCKEFVENYHGDLEFIAKHIDSINVKLSKFTELQEKEIIPMKDYE